MGLCLLGDGAEREREARPSPRPLPLQEAEYPDAASALAASRRFREMAQRAEQEAHRLAGGAAAKGSRVPDSPEPEPAEAAAEEEAAGGEEFPEPPANPIDAESLDDELSRRLAALRQAD